MPTTGIAYIDLKMTKLKMKYSLIGLKQVCLIKRSLHHQKATSFKALITQLFSVIDHEH